MLVSSCIHILMLAATISVLQGLNIGAKAILTFTVVPNSVAVLFLTAWPRGSSLADTENYSIQ
jgi:hypothetical protein